MARSRQHYPTVQGNSSAAINVADLDIASNKEATRWLGDCLDTQFTLKEIHSVRMKKGENALNLLRRRTLQMGLSSANCRKVM